MKINQLKKCISVQWDQLPFFEPSITTVLLANSYNTLIFKYAIFFISVQQTASDAPLSNSSITDDQYSNHELGTSTIGVGAISVFSIFGFFGLSLFCYSRLFPNSQIYHISDSEESKEEPRP